MKKFFIILLISLLVVTVAGGVYFFVNKDDDSTTAACQHETLSVIDGVPATCDLGGYSSGVKCADCGEILVEPRAILALGHDMELHTAQEPTCTTDGHTEYAACSRCDYSTFECVPSLGHKIVVIEGRSPTCGRTGTTDSAQCSTCGKIIVAARTISTLGHDMVVRSRQEPTCAADGYVEKVCSRCDYSTVESIHALEHSSTYEYSYETTDGYIVSYKKCGDCGEQLSESTYKEKPEIEENDDTLYIKGFKEILDFEYAGKDYRYVIISSDVKYVGSCAFAYCPEYLVIEVDSACDTSKWAEDWYMGNGDGETPYTVIYK